MSLACKGSPTGQFLSGARSIATPREVRRTGNGKSITVRGAQREQPQGGRCRASVRQTGRDHRRVQLGKSTLVNEILYKALWKRLEDSHPSRACTERSRRGLEHVHKVVSIDQSPIGRNSRSNPATYVGFYDLIRDLFTAGAAGGRARLQGRAASASTSRVAASTWC